MSGENLVLIGFALLPLAFAGAVFAFFRRTDGAPSVGRLVAGNLLILLLLVSLALPIGEVYFRYFYDATESFGFSKVGNRWYQTYFKKNVSGYRDSLEEYRMHLSAGRPRVTFVGDSFTTGQGVPDVEHRFVNRIRALRGHWEVHAIADNGWHTGVELEELETITGQGYQLDEVVLVYCLNDAADLVPEWQESVEWVMENRRETWLVAKSYLINTYYYRWMAARNPRIASYYDFMLEAYSGAIWEAQRERLLALMSFATERGAKLRVVTFPFLNLMGGGEYEYAWVHDTLGTFWREHGVPHLDLLGIFASSDPGDLVVNPYDAHPNERAHEMAARAIAAFLEAESDARRRPASVAH